MKYIFKIFPFIEPTLTDQLMNSQCCFCKHKCSFSSLSVLQNYFTSVCLCIVFKLLPLLCLLLLSDFNSSDGVAQIRADTWRDFTLISTHRLSRRRGYIVLYPSRPPMCLRCLTRHPFLLCKDSPRTLTIRCTWWHPNKIFFSQRS